jgi:hypothetical protein
MIREQDLTSLNSLIKHQNPVIKVSSTRKDDFERVLADIRRFRNNNGKILVLGR